MQLPQPHPFRNLPEAEPPGMELLEHIVPEGVGGQLLAAGRQAEAALVLLEILVVGNVVAPVHVVDAVQHRLAHQGVEIRQRDDAGVAVFQGSGDHLCIISHQPVVRPFQLRDPEAMAVQRFEQHPGTGEVAAPDPVKEIQEQLVQLRRR